MIETSPFAFDGPAMPEDVVGREREIAAITDRAMHGRFVLLYAPRRYGKTSLLRRLAHQAHQANELSVVTMDFLAAQTMSDIVARIGQGLRSAPDHLRRPVDRFLKPRPELSLEIGFGPAKAGIKRGAISAPQALEEILHGLYDIAAQADRKLLVVMDEFQAVADVESAEGRIRSVIQHQRDRVSYVFSGSEPSLLSNVFGQRSAPLYGQAEQFRLFPLLDADLADHISAKFEETEKDVGAALAPLLVTAAGHPQRAMYLAHHVWNKTTRDRAADLETWHEARQSAMSRAESEFVATYHGLDKGQRKTLRLVSWNEKLFGAAANRIGLPSGTARAAVGALTRDGLVWEPRDDGLQPVDPLLAAWLCDQNPAP